MYMECHRHAIGFDTMRLERILATGTYWWLYVDIQVTRNACYKKRINENRAN